MIIFRDKTFVIDNGPNLPKPLAGHCQLFIAEGQILVFGGINAVTFNNTVRGQIHQNIHYSNKAYLWSNETWSEVPTENPCPIEGQDLAYQQPCTNRVQSNQMDVIIVTFAKGNSCTSIFNLLTYNWSSVTGTKTNIPIGGHLVTSLDETRVFYIGGLYHKPNTMQSLDVYELVNNEWRLTEAKLPFGISSNETKTYHSLHNVTIPTNN